MIPTLLDLELLQPVANLRSMVLSLPSTNNTPGGRRGFNEANLATEPNNPFSSHSRVSKDHMTKSTPYEVQYNKCDKPHEYQMPVNFRSTAMARTETNETPH